MLTEAEGNQTQAYIHVNSRRQSSESGQTEEQKIGQRPPEAGGLTWELPTGCGGGGARGNSLAAAEGSIFCSRWWLCKCVHL